MVGKWTEKESILFEAHNLVHGVRGEDYGHPYHDFGRTAKIWSAILGVDVTPEQVALCMIGVKISRECNRPSEITEWTWLGTPKRWIWWLITENTGSVELASVEKTPSLSLGVYL